MVSALVFALGTRGCVFFRMWASNVIVVNPLPISALGVKPPHLQSLRFDKLLISFKPQILKHHIPELPSVSAAMLAMRPTERNVRCEGGGRREKRSQVCSMHAYNKEIGNTMK